MAKGHDGDLYGSLSDNGWVGTSIELRGCTADQTLSYARSWFDESIPDPAARLWPFAQTGGEGSTAALWRDGEGRVRIVHLGSGSGSMMTCVLADDAVDFLRLLAIGYREICWNAEFGAPPEPWDADHEIVWRSPTTKSCQGQYKAYADTSGRRSVETAAISRRLARR